MELSNNSSLSSSFLYQQIAKDKSESSSIQKDLKSTFEKNDSIDISNNKNTQRDEESKKIENITSSISSLNNAKEELIKNSNLNKLFIQSLT
jgi:hypothetical protein